MWNALIWNETQLNKGDNESTQYKEKQNRKERNGTEHDKGKIN